MNLWKRAMGRRLRGGNKGRWRSGGSLTMLPRQGNAIAVQCPSTARAMLPLPPFPCLSAASSLLSRSSFRPCASKHAFIELGCSRTSSRLSRSLQSCRSSSRTARCSETRAADANSNRCRRTSASCVFRIWEDYRCVRMPSRRGEKDGQPHTRGTRDRMRENARRTTTINRV